MPIVGLVLILWQQGLPRRADTWLGELLGYDAAAKPCWGLL